MADDNLLGFKAATAVAGFMGAVVSLSAIKPLSKFQACAAVLTGAVTSAYGTPALAYYAQISEIPVQNGLAFLIGLVAMHLIPGILRVAQLFREDPMGFWRRGK